jgi:hypothetical protein
MHARDSAVAVATASKSPDITATNSTVAGDRPRHLTRRQIPPFLLEKLDLPLGYGTLCKVCMDGEGPTPKLQFGQRILYEEAEVVRWALARCRPVPAKADSPAATADDTGTYPKPKRGRPPKPRPEINGTTSDNMPSANTSVTG